MKKLLACILALFLASPAALAAGFSYDGTVVSTATSAVLAPAAGIIGEVRFQAGQRVAAGEEVAAMQMTTVYAEQSGTVRVLGKAGESVATLTSRYGAPVYIEPDVSLTLTGSTNYAYNDPANKNIHPGEIVYLKPTSTTNEHRGKAMVTVVSGTRFTVEVLEGTVEDEDLVYIYRSPDYAADSRIGRGTVTYTGALAMTGAGTGVISSMLVTDGAHVEAGDPLYTTVEASAYAWRMAAPASGVVSAVSVTPGTAVEAGALIAQIHPDSAMRLEVIVEAADLQDIPVGASAVITFDNGVQAQGVVECVAGTPYVPETTDEEEEDDDDTTYFIVYLTFTADQHIPYGMTARVSIGE